MIFKVSLKRCDRPKGPKLCYSVRWGIKLYS